MVLTTDLKLKVSRPQSGVIPVKRGLFISRRHSCSLVFTEQVIWRTLLIMKQKLYNENLTKMFIILLLNFEIIIEIISFKFPSKGEKSYI